MVHLGEHEQLALEELKKTLSERYGLLDFRLFGSKARGDAAPDSDIDVMAELEEYTPRNEAEIDELTFRINLRHDCFISLVIYGRREIEEGPLGESPLYKVILREGVSL